MAQIMRLQCLELWKFLIFILRFQWCGFWNHAMDPNGIYYRFAQCLLELGIHILSYL